MMPVARSNPKRGPHAVKGPASLVASMLALLILVPTPATAQPSDPPPQAAPAQARRPVTLSAAFGWSNSIAAERFAPIWITIDPGSRPLDGTVSLLIPQDAVQEARLLAPFAAAAGRPATVEFAASLPVGASRIVAQVRDQSGRVVASQTWASAPTGREQPLPPALLLYEDIIASIGSTGLPVAAKAWSPGILPVPSRPQQGWNQSPVEPSHDLFQHVLVTDVQADSLPTAWVAYDGLRCIVLDAAVTRSISQVAARAIKEWVLDGGRLVLLADEPGASWVGWLTDSSLSESLSPSDERALPITLADVARLSPPEALAAIIASAPRSESAGEPAAVPAPQLGARPIALTPRGRELGWRTHWAITPAAGASEPNLAASSLLAEGPVGLGFVCIVGFDPADAVLGVDRNATAAVWKHVLAGAMEPFRAESGRRDTSQPWMIEGSGDHALARTGITAGLDHMADFRVPAGSIFYIVAGACFVVAMLVGPVDAVVLKRLGKRQHSWLTALGWITGASVLAWALPMVGREGEGRLGRVSVIDQVHDRLGSPVLSRQTTLTGIFSSRPGNATLATQDPTAWWRGVSSVTTYAFSRRQRDTGSPITLEIGDVTRPAGSPGGSEAAAIPARASALRSVPMPMWTFRTLMERGSGSLPLIARVSRQAEKEWRVSIAGMPEGAVVRAAELAIGPDRWPITLTTDPQSGHLVALGVGGRAAQTEQPAVEPAVWHIDHGTTASDSYPYTYRYNQSPLLLETSPGYALAIMGPDARTDAAQRLLASGRWGVLHLFIEGAPIDAASRLTDTSRRTIIARLIIPLDEPASTVDVPRWSPPDRPPEPPAPEEPSR